MKMSKTLTYSQVFLPIDYTYQPFIHKFIVSQPLFGTFDEETVIPQKEVKERRKNTAMKNVLNFDIYCSNGVCKTVILCRFQTQQVKPVAVIQQKKKKEEQEAQAVNVVINQIIEVIFQ